MTFGGFASLTLIDYPGKTAAMVYTVGCNLRCAYCHNPELVNETVEDVFLEEFILSFLRARCSLLDGVVVTGGEPTMHGDELLAFLRRVKAMGFLVKLDTNGTNPGFLKAAAKEGLLDYVAMDIKAPLAVYHRIAGRPVDVGAIAESIDFLRRGVIDYEFRTTVVKALLSPEDIEAIARAIAGAKRYYLQKFVPTKILNPQFRRKVSYADDEFMGLQKAAAKHVAFCGIR
ncbi:anaerobic ribonucleoside-triphosphate reductase activating protein [Candidatus Parcubacteria bacterium]|nr:anaerobic ribonucleoside-triphosphate reductase activating protein [Candidatus Parcubacteria bacterium]